MFLFKTYPIQDIHLIVAKAEELKDVNYVLPSPRSFEEASQNRTRPKSISKASIPSSILSNSPKSTPTSKYPEVEEEWFAPLPQDSSFPTLPKPFDELDEETSPVLPSSQPKPVTQNITSSSYKSHPLE